MQRNADNFDDFDDVYQYYMQKVQTDPEGAGQEFLQRLRSSKPKRRDQQIKLIKTIEQLEKILQGDESAWQYGSRNITDAIQFLISNTLMGGMGLGVLRPGMESVVADVANMISEDVDFQPMTPIQKRMKSIAESYGFSVYVVR